MQGVVRMRAAGKLAASVLAQAGLSLQAGMTTNDIDVLVHELTVAAGAYPSPLNYSGFPKSVCTSLNECICHGIPSLDSVIQDGDIINIDVTVYLDGYHGDTSRTFLVGAVSPEAKALVEVRSLSPLTRQRELAAVVVLALSHRAVVSECCRASSKRAEWLPNVRRNLCFDCAPKLTNASRYTGALAQHTKESLNRAIAVCKPGASFQLIGAAIHDYADEKKLGVVRSFVGHGVGQMFHSGPAVLHYRARLSRCPGVCVAMLERGERMHELEA